MIYKNLIFDLNKYQNRIDRIKTINESFLFQEDFSFSFIDKISTSSHATTISATSSNEIEGIKENTHSIHNQEFQLLNYNYNQALIEIKENYSKITINAQYILELHKKLFINIETINQEKFTKINPGKFKNKQNYLINENQQIIFTPSSPIETPEQIITLCKWFNESPIDPLLKSVIFVFDFLEIHPFNDGNGRISRLLTNLLFLQSGVNFLKYVPFEKYLLDYKEQYLSAITKSQINWKEDKNDYTDFINLHFDAIEILWEKWKAMVTWRATIKEHKINKIGEVLMLIKDLREKFIPITKANIKSNALAWQANIPEATLKDIIFNLSQEHVLILTKQSKISFYDINTEKFDQYYAKYVGDK